MIKRILIIAIFVLVVIGGLLFRGQRQAPRPLHPINSVSSDGHLATPADKDWLTNTNLAVAGRARLSDTERLIWLERNREVPPDAEYMDWYLAQKTSWWGKPLDPKTFWTNRVIWNDASALDLARRHGRCYPPIPTGDLKFNQISDQDRVLSGGGVETWNFDFHANNRETAFWNNFFLIQPKPPADLDREMVQVT